MDKLKQAIISKIHGSPWEKVRWIESTGRRKEQLIESALEDKKFLQKNCGYEESDDYDCGVTMGYDIELYYNFEKKHFVRSIYGSGEFVWAPKPQDCKPITLSRVLQALHYKGLCNFEGNNDGETIIACNGFIDIEWKLLKEDKSTATLEDQSPETIQALESIFLTQENFVRAEDICLIDLSGNGGHAVPSNSKNINPKEDEHI